MVMSKETFEELKEKYQFQMSEAYRIRCDAARRERYWLDCLKRLDDEFYGEQDEQGSTELSDGRDEFGFCNMMIGSKEFVEFYVYTHIVLARSLTLGM